MLTLHYEFAKKIGILRKKSKKENLQSGLFDSKMVKQTTTSVCSNCTFFDVLQQT